MSGSFFKFLNKEIIAPRVRKPPSKLKKRAVRIIQGLILLAALCFSSWRVSLYIEIENRFSALKKAGLPTTGSEFSNWLAPVSDAENGALPLSEAFAHVRTFSDSRSNEVNKLSVIERTNIWSSETKLLAKDYVGLNKPLLEEVREILRFTRFRFPTDYSYGLETLLPHLTDLKKMAHLFELQSLVAAEADCDPSWIEDAKGILGLARTLDDEPIVISFLVRASIINIAVKTTEKNLSRCQPGQAFAENLQSAFTSVTVSNLLSRAFIGELAIDAPTFRLSRAEAENTGSDDEGNTRARAPQRYAGKPAPFMWFTGFLERDLNFFLATMTKGIALATNSTPGSLALNNHFEKASVAAEKHFYILSGMLLPSFSKVANREASTQADLRLVTTALAIERYRALQGKLPAKLDELVPTYLAAVPNDPFDDAPLRYLRPAIGYVIYSIGDDLRDDGGRERPKNKKSSDKTSYDLTFVVER